jgi:cytochrome P450
MDFVNLIESKYLSTSQELKALDLARVSQYFTLDVLTDVAFGYPFGFLAADDDLHDYIKSLGPLMPFMELQSNITWLSRILNNKYVKKLMTPTANDGSGMGKMIGVAQQAVAERYKPGAEQKEDMLGSFIKHGLTQLQAESESLLQVMAGADSTATAVRVIMYLIITNPLVYAKLRAELDDADRKNLLVWPVLTNAQAISLPYLQAVIKEGLRAWPPGVGISTKWVPPEGDTLEDGRFIPGGTRIGWSAWGTQHNKEIYGDDAYYFRPERWLELEPGSKTLLRMERTHELIFGNGRYGCLGKSLAFIELNKVFATVRNLSAHCIKLLESLLTGGSL